MFSDLLLSRRLERAEGHACKEYAEALRRLFSESGAEWIECAGVYAVFGGTDSPVTQSFGVGIFDNFDAASLDEIERFFFDRGAPADHEVSPFAGGRVLGLLCERHYVPIEISSVLYRPVEKSVKDERGGVRVRVIGPEESQLWSDVNARGWSQEHPELFEVVQRSGEVSTARKQSVCFLAELEGEPGAAGGLCLHEGVALFAGAATIPELRRRGLQSALLEARLQYAYDHGCDLMMMVTELGSNSQRNAERQGFRIAYTRLKWRLPYPK